MKRRPMRELLDSDAGTPAEIADSMQDLRWFNRWFGGLPTVRRLLHDALEHSGKKAISILDIAAGDGFVPATMHREFAERGVSLEFTLLDRRATHLPRNGSVPKLAADALNLPVADSSFDFVSSSLFVHHLPPEEVVVFMREALRVCKVAVLIHDLVRNPLHLVFAYAGVPLYRSRITRTDAPASVRQAYTVAELTKLIRQSGAGQIHVRTHRLYRMGIVALKAGIT